MCYDRLNLFSGNKSIFHSNVFPNSAPLSFSAITGRGESWTILVTLTAAQSPMGVIILQVALLSKVGHTMISDGTHAYYVHALIQFTTV